MVSRCGHCMTVADLVNGLCHGCRVHHGYVNEEE